MNAKEHTETGKRLQELMEHTRDKRQDPESTRKPSSKHSTESEEVSLALTKSQ
jgi:hypothetical protein